MMMSLKDLIEAEQSKFVKLNEKEFAQISATDIDSLIEALKQIRSSQGNLSLTIPNVFKLLCENR